jgi:hypothetical protein
MKKKLLFNFLLLFAIGFSQNAPITFETGGQLVGPFHFDNGQVLE